MATAEQLAVINHQGGHALVSAVAGSGKSTTLIERIISLVKAGGDPSRILVLMFNKSARDDFASRLATRGAGLSLPEVFTFHGFGNRLCNALSQFGAVKHAELASDTFTGLRFGRTVLTQVNEALDEMEQIDLSSEVVLEFLEAMDLLKGALYSSGTVPAYLPEIDKRFISAFKLFESMRADAGIRFFSDLIYDPVTAALENTAVAAKISDRYDHVILDEYQDINEAQMALVRLVAGTRAKVLAVGDEDQTIYGWRGARPDYMTSLFEKEFPGAIRYSLSRTFRYGHALSLLANHVISHNRNRNDKLCISGTDKGTDLRIRMHAGTQGLCVADEVVAWKARGRRYSEVGILVRQYANSIPVELALQQAKVPYRLVGAAPFVDRPEVIALRGYMALASGEFRNMLNPDKVFATTCAMLSMPSLYLRRDLIEVIAERVSTIPGRVLDVVTQCLARIQGVKSFTQRHRDDVMAHWQWAAQQGPQVPAARFLGDLVRRLKLFDHLVKNTPRSDVADEKIRMIHELIDLAHGRRHSVQSFVSFLDEMSASLKSQANEDSVLVTSVHRAKGMEWPLVVLPDLADGLFPYVKSDASSPSIEDERRLFYVAATRAIETLTMVAPLDRQLVMWSKDQRHGHPQLAQIKASRFMYEGNIELSLQAGDAITAGESIPKKLASPTLSRYLHALKGLTSSTPPESKAA